MATESANANRKYIYQRGVMLRKTFNPNRGPRVSPAPNSICVDTHTRTHRDCVVTFVSAVPVMSVWYGVYITLRTSPQPLAEVTRRKDKLMLPPPFPLCVERDPAKTAVSLAVNGA